MRDALLDLLLGSGCVGCGRPGRLLCSACTAGLPTRAVPARPTPCPPGLAPGFAAGPYDGVLRDLVLAHKERSAFALAGPLGALLAVAVAAVDLDPRWPVALVPVPSRRSVVVTRGHDPLLRLTRRAGDRLRAGGWQVGCHRLLRVAGRVADQSGLGHAERQANLAGSMAARTDAVRALARMSGRAQVLVCDDVLTTGATAREAQRALAAVGVRTTAIACVAATVRRLPVSGLLG